MNLKESGPQKNNFTDTRQTDGIEISFYTDPLCCWSWAMRPQWQQFLELLEAPVSITWKMAGLLPSWRHFNDAVNAISKPIQMGPEWMHARAVSGVYIDNRIWITDPPASSFPACIAVKAAGLQSPAVAAEYLYQAQLAVMSQGLNIAKQVVLGDIAERVHSKHNDFDVAAFHKALLGEEARDAFRKDLQDCRFLNISRLPAIVFRGQEGASIISGYQTAEALMDVARSVRGSIRNSPFPG